MTGPRLRFYRRLGFQMGITVALVTAIAFGATGWLLVRGQQESLARELTLRVLDETRSLALAASSPLLRHDPELGLHPLILTALKEMPELEDLVIVDSQGVVQGHRDLLKVGSRHAARAPAGGLLMAGDDGSRAWIEGNQLVISRPIFHLDRAIGTLVAHASQARIEAAVRSSARRVATTAAVGTALAIVLVLTLVARNLQPLGDLRQGVQRIGAGDLATRIHVSRSNELGMLAGLINDMAAGLHKAQQDLIQKERMDHELGLARELQSTLLPRRFRVPPRVQLAAHYTAALEVSGDYYDVIDLGNQGSLALVAADVSGKGVPGLVVMAMLRVILRGLSQPGRSPADVLATANRMMRGTMRRDMFITCMYGVYDPRAHTFRYASAGHCPPVLFGGEAAPQCLRAGGKPMGMFPERVFERSLKQYELAIESGQGLLLYTDGLVEAMNAAGKPLGREAVLDRLALGEEDDAASLVAGLLETVELHRDGFHATDDLTLLALRREAEPAGEAPPRDMDSDPALVSSSVPGPGVRT